MYVPLSFLMRKHGENFPVYGTTRFYITTTHHHHPPTHPPPKKFVLKDSNAEDDTNVLIGTDYNEFVTIQSEVS